MTATMATTVAVSPAVTRLLEPLVWTAEGALRKDLTPWRA